MLSHAEGKQPPVSERTPLIMTGASFVETMAKPAVAAGGTTLREAVDKGGQHGLVSDGKICVCVNVSIRIVCACCKTVRK